MHNRPDQFECLTDEAGPVPAVRPRGQLDLASSAVLRSVLLKMIAEEPSGIIVDLSELTVEEDICLMVFPAVVRQAAALSGCAVVLCAAPPAVADLMHALGVDRTVRICAIWTDAWQQVQRAHHAQYTGKVRERFPPKPQSLAAARAMAAAACARWQVPERPTGLVQAVLTELVSNAVRHAGTPIEVVLRCTARYVHVAVYDQDRRPARLCGPDTPDADSGRGLLLVDAFSTAWGCAPAPDGKVVWATIRHHPTGA
ncbi:MAG TPA: ATP-binding protein [Micromonosporaceae bacterium]|nr:ATP-binding protein [Micromonosporaceae bacterium]